jgi:hypothetical protein
VSKTTIFILLLSFAVVLRFSVNCLITANLDYIYIISHLIAFVKRFLKVFLIFSKNFLRAVALARLSTVSIIPHLGGECQAIFGKI